MPNVILLFTGRKIMMTKTLWRWALITLVVMAPLLYAGYIHYQRNHFSCQVHTTIVDDRYLLDVIASYSFNGGEGVYETSGEYIPHGQPPVAISNKITFNYWQEGGDVIMVSSETNERPKAAQPFRMTIPDFFHVRDRGLRMQIIPANNSSYFFLYGNSPVLYCTKE